MSVRSIRFCPRTINSRCCQRKNLSVLILEAIRAAAAVDSCALLECYLMFSVSAIGNSTKGLLYKDYLLSSSIAKHVDVREKTSLSEDITAFR